MNKKQRIPLPELDSFAVGTFDKINEEVRLTDIITNDMDQNIDAYIRLLNGEDGELNKDEVEELFYQALYQMRQSMNMIDMSTHRITEVNNSYFLRGAFPYSTEKNQAITFEKLDTKDEALQASSTSY